MRSYKEMADLLVAKLTDAGLVELGVMMDGDKDNTLLFEIEVVNERRHPELFDGNYGTRSAKREVP
jgi:hypothetical protein